MRQSDDESARSLLGMLADDTPPPSRVDIGALVRNGRRRARRRRLVAVTATALVTIGAVAVVPVAVDVVNQPEQQRPVATGGAAQPEDVPLEPAACTAHQLPLPDMTIRSEVFGGDPSGRFLVGTASDKRGQSVVVRWDRGQLTTLKVPVEQPTQLVVNSRGDVAGDGYVGPAEKGRSIAWVYRNDAFVNLPTGGGQVFAVAGINERGDILGTVQGGKLVAPEAPASGSFVEPSAPAGAAPGGVTDSNPVPGDPLAIKRGQVLASNYDLRQVVWPGENPDAVRVLAAPPNVDLVTVAGIDDDGTVVGRSVTKALARVGGNAKDPILRGARGLVWAPDGSVRELAAPPGYGPDVSIQSIRNGWVIGSYLNPAEGAMVAGRWNLRTGEVRPLSLKFVTSVNRYGWVGGYVVDGAGKLAPALATDGRLLVLPLAKGFDRNTNDPITVVISDNGQQIGSVLHDVGRDTRVAFRWSCV
ncbi:hypothetical protein [Micromonospora sp. NBC_01796]|uniref:hypothetical protein n=1 Tax=Micromonospora sp. NBC_01796 TaxID=2975987 RepID=UPI002DDA6BF7|nr:hypothetical protein [Micromonospora sp. NBC_01796]WSA87702.1 hypothetical protein OIE47_08900 [Micromonospora sp. NBC_01796]